MTFNEQLKTIRNHKGMTQQETADAVGIAKTTYIGYENGSREPKLSELKKIAVLFNMTLSELCMDADTRNVEENLVLLFGAVKSFDKDEMKTFTDLVEALVIKHHANKAKNLTQP